MKARSEKRKTIFCFAFYIVILHFAFYALHLPQAQAEGISLKLQPSILQIRSTAPSNIRAPFKLINESREEVELKVILKRFEASSEENGQIIYALPGANDERTKDSFLKKVEIVDNGFVIDTVILSPRQTKTLTLSIDTAKNEPPLDHYFSLIFLTIPKEADKESQSRERQATSLVQMGISLPVLLSLGKNKETSSFIEEFSSPVFVTRGSMLFTLKMKNSGTHFISPSGAVFIKNMFGQTVGRVDIPTTNILANSSRYFSNDSLSPQPKLIWPENFLLGFYTATLQIVNDDNQLLYTRNIHFLAFPISLLALAFVVVSILIIIIRRLKKKLSEE